MTRFLSIHHQNSEADNSNKKCDKKKISQSLKLNQAII